jgi:FecR protein/Putative zinc-finger
MSAPDCPRVSLVEALHDGRLGPQERASMERHVAVCSSCTALARDLGRIGEALRAPMPQATPLEHQRARLELLRRATEPQRGRLSLSGASAASLPWAPFAEGRARFAFAAALLALAVVIGWVGGRVTAQAGGANAIAAVAFHMPRPPRLAPPRETTLRPSDDARFDRGRSAGLDVVTLATGAIDMTVRPLAPGERFVVRTGDAEVEVRGTAVRVEADQGRIRGVAVADGTVEVRYAGFSAIIPSGGSWHTTGPAAAPVEPAPPPAAPPPATAPAPPPAPRALVAVRTAPRARVRPPVAKVIPETPPASEDPRPEIQPVAMEMPAPGLSPASRDFAGAMQALRLGDYTGSATQLAAFSISYPSDARADEADYLRAIALQRAGRAPDATATARRYLVTRPAGAHRAEAKLLAGDF